MFCNIVPKPISELAFINPYLTRKVEPSSEVSFIPMVDVTDSGQWVGSQVRKQSAISVGYTPFEEGDILFAKITPCMENGKGCHAIGLRNGVGYGSTEFHVLRAKPGTNSRFLYHWIKTEAFRKNAKGFMIGSAGQQRVQTTFFNHFCIPQLDEDEQRIVASILDAADEAVAKTEALITKLKVIKQGLLRDLLTYGLDEDGQIREPIAHPEQFKDSSLGRIPKTWLPSSVGSCLSVLYRYPTYYGIEYVNSGVYEVRGELISDHGQLSQNPSEYRMISENTAQRFSRARLEKNDFVMSVRGTMGKIGIVPSWLAGAVITANLIRIQFNPSKVSARWALHWLTSFLFQKELDLFSSGTTIKTIQVPLISAIRFRRPPVEEQNIIACYLDTQDERIEAEEEYLSKLKAIKKGLMQDLLTGRVRVQFDKTVAQVER